MRCRLGLMSDLIGHASEAQLGGRKLARGASARVAKAKTLAGDPPSTKRLKKAAKQLKSLSTKLSKAAGAGKADPALAVELNALSSQAQLELAGLTT